MFKQALIMAYATLVRAKKYILDEGDRASKDQILVPEAYTLVVAEYLVSNA